MKSVTHRMAVPRARGVVWVPFALKYKICGARRSTVACKWEQRLWVRAPARSHVSSQSGPPAESPVKASVRPAVEGPHCLAHFCVHAAALLKKLPDRAAKGHEALGEVDPQHGRVRSSAWLAVKGTCLAHGVQHFHCDSSAGCTWLKCKHKTEGVRGRAHPGKPDPVSLARCRLPWCGASGEVEPRCVALAVGWSKACAVRPCACPSV